MPNPSPDKSESIAAALPPMRAIQAFEAIVRRGSVAGAADELGVSSGAISQQLRKIERELGVRLLEREGRSLTLTSWGRIYYQQVRNAFNELRHAQHRLQIARAKRGIVLSAPPSLALWLQQLLLQWSRNHRDVNLRLIGSEQEPVLQDESIDFRLCYGSDARRYDRFAELFQDAVVPACSPEFLRTHRVESEADILKCPLIDIAWDSRHRQPPSWSDWAWTAGLAPPQQPGLLAFSLAGAAIDAALDSGGFVLGQISIIAEHVRQGRLVVPIERRLNLPESYFLAWERDALDRQVCAEFRNALIAAGRLQQDLSRGSMPLKVTRS
jgi:LysR family glycine cleavage system transcriptional activator